MASVKDLEAVFGAEPRLTPGAVRQLTRVLQEGGLLPRAKRGSRGPLPELTPQHCAAWLVGLAVTRRSGARRNIKEAVRRINQVLGLVAGGVQPRLSFGDLLAKLIVDYVNQQWSDEWRPLRLTFINDPMEPTVELKLAVVDADGAEQFEEQVFVTREYLKKTKKEIVGQDWTEFSDAFVIGAEVLFLFHKVFEGAEPEGAA